MAEVTINNCFSYFTYTSQNMKTAKKELEDFFMTTQNTEIKIILYEIGFDGNYYYDLKTGRRFESYYE